MLTTARPRSSRRDRLSLAATGAATAAVVVVAAVQVLLAVVRPVDGIGAIVQILSAHLAIAGLALSPLALLGAGRLRVALVGLLAVSLVRFGPEWISLPAAGGPGETIEVVSWNLEIGSRALALTLAGLREIDADVVLLQELTAETAAAIEADGALATRYPHRSLDTRPDVTDLGVVSRFPIVDPSFAAGPAIQEFRLDAPAGAVSVVHAHPLPARLGALAGGLLPLGIDPSRRDRDLELIRGRVDARIAAGEPVILAGDFNTGPTEAAYERLLAGLHDAHAEVGLGPGWTWRSSRFEWLPIGLLRLDLIAGGPGVVPTSTSVACPPAGDHCQVSAVLRVGSRP